jgi:hypothetical protein
MNFILKNILFGALFFGLCNAKAQDILSNAPAEDPGAEVLYRIEKHGGLLIHSSGWGGFYRTGKHITGKTKRFYEVELVSMKHPKEVKTVNPYYENAKGYVYGKLNSVTVLRGGVGLQRKLHGKDGIKGIEVRYLHFIGPSLAFAKPVYLEIGYPTVPYTVLRTERYDPAKHFVNNIYGSGPMLRGIEQTQIYPGLYTKLGFAFDYAGAFNSVKGLEVGATFDLYPKAVPIMATAENSNYFLSFYLSIFIGVKEY